MRALLIVSLVLLAACKESVDNQNNFDWQGHRGARGVLPENSIPGFIYALDQGVNTLEMDVVITADSHVVVSHEPFLNSEICLDAAGNTIPERTERDFNIYRMSLEELRSFDCGMKIHPGFSDQQRVSHYKPLLAEVIETAEAHALKSDRSLPSYNIEIKSREDWDNVFHPSVEQFADLVLGVVERSGVKDRVSIQSFDKRALRYINSLKTKVDLVLLEEDDRAPEIHIEELGFTPEIYSCYYKKVDADLVSYCHDQGMKVVPWTVNEVADMKYLIELKVDGIITDYPQRSKRFRIQ